MLCVSAVQLERRKVEKSAIRAYTATTCTDGQNTLVLPSNSISRKQKRSRRPMTEPTRGEPLSPLRARLRQRSESGTGNAASVKVMSGFSSSDGVRSQNRKTLPINRSGGSGGARGVTVRVAETAATAVLMQQRPQQPPQRQRQ